MYAIKITEEATMTKMMDEQSQRIEEIQKEKGVISNNSQIR